MQRKTTWLPRKTSFTIYQIPKRGRFNLGNNLRKKIQKKIYQSVNLFELRVIFFPAIKSKFTARLSKLQCMLPDDKFVNFFKKIEDSRIVFELAWKNLDYRKKKFKEVCLDTEWKNLDIGKIF